MGPDKALNDYLQLLKSPTIYPDIAQASQYLTPFIAIVSDIIAVVGIIAMIVLLLRIAIDVLYMTGLMGIVSERVGTDRLLAISSFAGSKNIPVGDPIQYVKNFGLKLILMFAFVGLMVSGQFLPLAGTATASIGAVIQKVANVNPVPYIQAFSINTSALQNLSSSSTVNNMINLYNQYYAAMQSAEQQVQNGKLSQADYDKAAVAYFNAYYATAVVAEQMQINVTNIQNRQLQGKSVSADEKKLMNFDYSSFNVNPDYQILDYVQKGVKTQAAESLKNNQIYNQAISYANSSGISVYVPGNH